MRWSPPYIYVGLFEEPERRQVARVAAVMIQAVCLQTIRQEVLRIEALEAEARANNYTHAYFGSIAEIPSALENRGSSEAALMYASAGITESVLTRKAGACIPLK